MQTAVLIINHIHFPYRLFEQALQWTKDNNADFEAMFLTHALMIPASIPGKTDPESSETAFSNADLTVQMQEIVSRHISFMEEQLAVHGLAFSSTVLTQPGLQEVVERSKDATKIFIEIQDEEKLKNLPFTWPELLHQLGRNRQLLSNKSHGIE
jgi:hypothetical protein